MNARDNNVSKRTARLASKTADDKVVLEAKQPRRSSILTWLEEHGPIADFPADPGYDDLLPLDDVKILERRRGRSRVLGAQKFVT